MCGLRMRITRLGWGYGGEDKDIWPTHPATLVNCLLLDSRLLLSSLSHQGLPSFRYCWADKNQKTSQKKTIFFRQLYSNSWPCSASQASKGRWKPITYNTCFAACGQPLTTLISSFPTLCQMMNSMATHRYSPYSLPSHTTTPSTLQPSSYTSSSLLPSTQGISNNIQVFLRSFLFQL